MRRRNTGMRIFITSALVIVLLVLAFRFFPDRSRWFCENLSRGLWSENQVGSKRCAEGSVA